MRASRAAWPEAAIGPALAPTLGLSEATTAKRGPGTTAPVKPRMKEARPSWRIADRGRHLLARES